MNVNRRGFLATGAAVAAGANVFSTSASAADPTPPAKPAHLKLSSQLGVIPGKDLAEKLALMEKCGFDGVELGGDIVGNEKKYEDAVKKTKLKISAICGETHTGDGYLVSEIVERRAEAIEALKRALTSAGALGSTGVIFVPAFNGQTKLGNQEIRKILLDKLPEIGEHAVKGGHAADDGAFEPGRGVLPPPGGRRRLDRP